jgi:hypothetical protein
MLVLNSKVASRKGTQERSVQATFLFCWRERTFCFGVIGAALLIFLVYDSQQSSLQWLLPKTQALGTDYRISAADASIPLNQQSVSMSSSTIESDDEAKVPLSAPTVLPTLIFNATFVTIVTNENFQDSFLRSLLQRRDVCIVIFASSHLLTEVQLLRSFDDLKQRTAVLNLQETLRKSESDCLFDGNASERNNSVPINRISKSCLLVRAMESATFGHDLHVWTDGTHMSRIDQLLSLDLSSPGSTHMLLWANSGRFSSAGHRQTLTGGWMHPDMDTLYTRGSFLAGTCNATRKFHRSLHETIKGYKERQWDIMQDYEQVFWQTNCQVHWALCHYVLLEGDLTKGKVWIPTMAVAEERAPAKIVLPFSMVNASFASPDPERYLYLNAHTGGLNNQLECLHLAATLSIQYNRTLWLHSHAYIGSRRHSVHKLLFEQIFDPSGVKLPVAISTPGSYPFNCRTKVPYENNHAISPDRIAQDPDPSARCIVFDCFFGSLHHVAPKSYFPHVEENLLPLSPLYRTLAEKVISLIRSNSKRSSNSELFRLLSFHIRRGDQKSYPLVDCSLTQLYPHVAYAADDDAYYSMCSSSKDSPASPSDELSWRQVTQHFVQCDRVIPLCIHDFDAVFVATNDVDYVKNLSIPNLFTMRDFTFVRPELCNETSVSTQTGECSWDHNHVMERFKIMEFLVEETILTLSNVYLPSLPSSVTDMVLHWRLYERKDSDQDAKLLQLQNDRLMDLYKFRSAHKFQGRTRPWESR